MTSDITQLQKPGVRNTSARFGWIAMILHWIFAVAFLGQFIIYLFMHNLEPSDLKWWFYDFHKSMGLTLLAVVTFRLIWRLTNPQPTTVETDPAWKQMAAAISHRIFYAGMFLMPISGFIGSKAGGFKASWFGVFEAPDLFGKNDQINLIAEWTHTVTFYAMAVLITLHIAAAMHHHFSLKDQILRRMTP